MQRENLAAASGENDRGWLPLGLQRVPRPTRKRRFRRSHPLAEVVSEVLLEAPAGPVLVVESDISIDLRGRSQIAFSDLTTKTSEEDGTGRFGAYLLGDKLQNSDNPTSVLDAARSCLRADGLLVLTYDARQEKTGATQPTGSLPWRFTKETIAALLFRQGFSRPRFFECDYRVVVSAVRSREDPPWSRSLRLSVVLPVYNERNTFKKTMELVLAKELPGVDIHLIVVESNSTDGTRDDVLEYRDADRVTLLLEDEPKGKGHAVRQGIEAATGDVILIQDADLEYDIDDYDHLLAPFLRCEAGFVLGKRTSSHGRWGLRDFGGNDVMSFAMNVGHLIFLSLFNTVYQQKLEDPFTMYKVFRRDCLEGLTFSCNRFDFDWELTAKLIRAGYEPIELPVTYRSRSFADGKKIRVLKDPLGWIWTCFRCRFSSLYSYR
jgi:Glycosyl transferase family 2